MKHGLFAELKRRHVYRVAVAYGVVGWLLIEVATQVFPVLHMPEWTEQFVILLIVVGFPIVLVFTWAFELTPEGVRRTQPADSPVAREPEQHHRVGRKLDFIIIGVLALAVGLLAWRLWLRHAPAPQVAGIPQKSIAVLPFENLSEDKTNGYFADGMQDLILTKLADIGDLKVISRTSTAKYASHPDDLRVIAEQLGVANILEGSVQKAGNTVLINVQLINARTDGHIWAEAYTRPLDNVFGVEGEVAGKIADALKARLSPAETRRLDTALSPDSVANDLYFHGEYFMNRGDISYDTTAYQQAISYFRQAIARVPDFALARAKLAYAECLFAWFGGAEGKTADLYDDALVQAEQALKLAPGLPDAHLAMGIYNYYGKGAYDDALQAFAEALALRPNDSNALAAKAYVLRRQAKFEDAIVVFRKALALDPRNTNLASEMGSTYMMLGRYPDAELALQRALALDPANTNATYSRALIVLFRDGDLDRALAEARGDDGTLRLLRVHLLTFARKYAQALTQLQAIPDTPGNFALTRNGGPKSLQLANLYRLNGEPERARALYPEALAASRAQLAALSGSSINRGFALHFVAQAELGLGQTDAGLADTAKLLDLAEHSDDHVYGPGLMQFAASLYAQAGHVDEAVQALSVALAAPGIHGVYSPVMLWIDPAWDPIRSSPGFRALQEKYARYRPATVPGDAPG